MKKFVVVLLGLLILLTGCRVDPEALIEEYLKQNYGIEAFTFERIEGISEISYDVFFNEWPDIHFTVTRTVNDIKDDYVDKVIQTQMDSLNLSWERGVEDGDILIYYKDYEAIDDIAGKVVEFIKTCKETYAFKPVSENYTLVLLPEETVNPLYPGYKICLHDGVKNYLGYKGPNRRFYIDGESLETERLAEEIRLCHIYYQYQFTTNRDESSFTNEDMEQYYELVSGVTGIADDKTEMVYSEADMLYQEFSFGSAYQILSTDELVTDIGPDRFTATANGRTVEFMITFNKWGDPESKCLVHDTGNGGSDQSDEESDGWDDTLRAAVEMLTGKAFSDTTPEKEAKKAAAKAEEKRLARLPVVEGYFANPSNVGETALVHNLEITLLSAKVSSTIEDRYMQYTVKDGKNWLFVRIRVENKGSQSAHLFDYIMTSENHYSARIADREANLYQAGDVIMANFDDIYITIPAGESAEGNVLFEIPEGLADNPENLVFVMFNQVNKHASFWLPEKIDGK